MHAPMHARPRRHHLDRHRDQVNGAQHRVHIIGTPQGLDYWSTRALGQTPRPVRAAGQCPFDLTVPYVSAGAPKTRHWLLPHEENLVIAACAVLLVVILTWASWAS